MAIWPLHMKSGQDTAQRFRLGNTALWTPARDAPLKVVTGLINDGGGVVTTVGGTMQVSVTPFRGVVQGTVSGTQGGYPVVSDAALTTTLPNGGGANVLYTIAALVEDSAFDASGQQRVTLINYPTAGGPPTSSGVIPLRQINLRAGLTAGGGGLLPGDLGADFRVFTVAVGGILPRLSSSRPSSPGEGAFIWETDTKLLRVWDGSVWKAIRLDNLITVDVFTSSGTWTKPADCKTVRRRLWGAGGAGGPALGAGSGLAEGGGGAGGAYCDFTVDANGLGASIAVTIGSGGAAGVTNPGPTGGTTTIGGLSAPGGTGGSGMTSSTASQLVNGGTGGLGVSGTFNVRGGDGGRGRSILGVPVFANFGGNGAMGGGVRVPTVSSVGAGAAGNFPGGGGTGAFGSTGNQNGGAGAGGLALVENVY